MGSGGGGGAGPIGVWGRGDCGSLRAGLESFAGQAGAGGVSGGLRWNLWMDGVRILRRASGIPGLGLQISRAG